MTCCAESRSTGSRGAGKYTRVATKGDLMNDLVDTTEMYLRTIYDLEEEGVIPLRARIA